LQIGQRPKLFVEQEAQVPDDRCHRCGELVTHVLKKLSTKSRDVLQPLVGFGELDDLLLETLHDLLGALAQKPIADVVGPLSMPSEELRDRLGEVRRVDRLGDEAVAPHGKRGVPVPFGCNRHDRDFLERWHPTKPQGDLISVQVRNVDVHQDEIR
jgi:hypothetical protein